MTTATEANTVLTPLEALKTTYPYMRAAYRDMLCKAGGYSEGALQRAMATTYWQKLAADVKAAEAVLVAEGVDPKRLYTAM